jgi:hypothetical protein
MARIRQSRTVDITWSRRANSPHRGTESLGMITFCNSAAVARCGSARGVTGRSFAMIAAGALIVTLTAACGETAASPDSPDSTTNSSSPEVAPNNHKVCQRRNVGGDPLPPYCPPPANGGGTSPMVTVPPTVTGPPTAEPSGGPKDSMSPGPPSPQPSGS